MVCMNLPAAWRGVQEKLLGAQEWRGSQIPLKADHWGIIANAVTDALNDSSQCRFQFPAQNQTNPRS